MSRTTRSPARMPTETVPRRNSVRRSWLLGIAAQMAITGYPIASYSSQLMAGHLADQDSDIDRRAEEELIAIKAFPTTRGMLLILPELVFAPRESRLSSSALQALEPLAQFLNEHPGRRVEIDGFSDGRGAVQDNQTLSQQRAQAVQSALVSKGATDANISAYGFGSQAPVASDRDPAGRRSNRRIEIVIARSGAAVLGWSDL